MKKDIVIRKLELSDAKDYVTLHNLVWRDAYKHIFPEEVFEDREKNIEKKIESIKKFIAATPKNLNLVAEYKNKIVGFMSATLNSNYEHYKDNGYAELMGMYIHPHFQGMGIGSVFKNKFLEWAKKGKAKKFVIGVLKDNLKARKIYEKWGGRLDNYIKPFEKLGKAYDEVFYVFEL